MTEPALSTPEFAPERALGWRNVGLDGLGCFLRCVEAVLLHDGYTAAQVAQVMAAPLELLRRTDWAGPHSTFPGCEIRWRIGDAAWPHLSELLAENTPAVIMPDAYWWPADEFEGRHHYRHHMVLAVQRTTTSIHVLDTDAPRERGYRREIEITDEVRRACSAVGAVVHGQLPQPSTVDDLRQVVERSVGLLAADVAEFDGFTQRRWTGGALDPLLARGLDVLVLGDVQPQLFLLAHTLDGGDDPALERVRTASAAAAARAQKLGLLLLGLHRFDAPGVYELAHEELVMLTGALRELLESMITTGFAGGTATPDMAAGDRFVARLRALTRWCFGEAPTI